MPIDWSDATVKDRLLAAIIASFDNKINCREVARLYGGEATYNSIECFLRKPKKDAAALKQAAAGVEGPAKSPAKPKTPRTPKTDGVKTGRVTKASSTPAAKGKKVTVNDGGSSFKNPSINDGDSDVTNSFVNGGSPLKDEIKQEQGDFNMDFSSQEVDSGDDSESAFI